MKRVLRAILAPVASLAIGFLCWWSAALALQSPTVLPYPGAVVASLFANLPYFLSCTARTLSTTLVALVLSSVISFALAALLILVPPIRHTAMPYLIVLRSAPIIVLAWIVHHQTGGDAQRTATIIAALMAIFPQVLMMMHEADFVPKPFLDVARTFGASPLQVRFYVRFLHAVPAFLEGMRLASSLCLVGVLVVEMAYPTDGIGKAIRTAMQQYEIADAFAALIVVIVVAYVWTIAFERAIGVLQGSLVGVAVDVDK